LNGSGGSALLGTERIAFTALRNRLSAFGPSFISAVRGFMNFSLPQMPMFFWKKEVGKYAVYDVPRELRLGVIPLHKPEGVVMRSIDNRVPHCKTDKGHFQT
jgi:hypothetical protein